MDGWVDMWADWGRWFQLRTRASKQHKSPSGGRWQALSGRQNIGPNSVLFEVCCSLFLSFIIWCWALMWFLFRSRISKFNCLSSPQWLFPTEYENVYFNGASSVLFCLILILIPVIVGCWALVTSLFRCYRQVQLSLESPVSSFQPCMRMF